MKKLLYKHLRNIKKNLFCNFVFLVLIFIFQYISPLLNGNIIDNLIYYHKFNDLIIISILLLFIDFIYIVIVLLQRNLVIQLKTKTMDKLITDIIEYYHNSEYKRIIINNPALICDKVMADCSSVSSFVIDQIPSAIINILTICVCSLFIFNKNANSFFIILCVNFIYIVEYFFVKKDIGSSTKEYKESNNYYYNSLYDQFHNVKFIKQNALYKQSNEYLKIKFKQFYISKFNFFSKMNLYESLDMFVVYFSSLLLLFFCAFGLYNNSLTIGDYIIINSFFLIIINKMKQIMEFAKKMTGIKYSFDRLDEIFNYKLEKNGSIELDRINELKLVDVNFSYDKHMQTKLINNFSYSFKSNNIYVLTGDNGSGKTTLLHIIIGLLQPIDGSIIINEKYNLSDLDKLRMRKEHIAISSTDFAKISESFYNNVICKLDIKKDIRSEIFKNFSEDIKDKQFDELSCGEMKKKELLIILAKDADIYILDEPTLGLDSNSKKIIIEYLNILKKNKIIILVSHDQEIINNSDIIINSSLWT